MTLAAPSRSRPVRFSRLSLATTAIISLVGFSARASAQRPSDSLEIGFRDPPASARPRTWWHWTASNVTKEGITKGLEWMKRVGIAGVQLADVAAGGGQTVERKIVFGTPEWLDALRHAAAEANRLGLEMDLFASPGWSLTGRARDLASGDRRHRAGVISRRQHPHQGASAHDRARRVVRRLPSSDGYRVADRCRREAHDARHARWTVAGAVRARSWRAAIDRDAAARVVDGERRLRSEVLLRHRYLFANGPGAGVVERASRAAVVGRRARSRRGRRERHDDAAVDGTVRGGRHGRAAHGRESGGDPRHQRVDEPHDWRPCVAVGEAHPLTGCAGALRRHAAPAPVRTTRPRETHRGGVAVSARVRGCATGQASR